MISATLRNTTSIIQTPVFIKQIRYGQYGLTQIIAEIPKTKLYSSAFIDQDDTYFIDIFDGLTTETSRVDVVQIQENSIRIEALGDLTKLKDNTYYSRFWKSTTLDDWSAWTRFDNGPDFPQRSATGSSNFAQSSIIPTDQNGLNLTFENGNLIPAGGRNGYLFRKYPTIESASTTIAGISFFFEASMAAPMRAFLQFRSGSFVAVQTIDLFDAPAFPGQGTSSAYHIVAPANSTYINFGLINDDTSSYDPPFAIANFFARISDVQVVSSVKNRINTTLTTAVTATGQQFVTPASMLGIISGLRMQIDGANATSAPSGSETVTVLSTTATTFEAVFAFTHAIGATVQAFLVTPDEIISDVVSFNTNINTFPIETDVKLLADETILAGNDRISIIQRVIQQYSSDHTFYLRNSLAYFAVDGFYSTTYKAIVTNTTLSSRLSTIRTLAKGTFQIEPGVDYETSGFATDLFNKYQIRLPIVISVDTRDETIANEAVQSALNQRQEIKITLTFTLQALFVDGGISIPLYWIRPGDKLVLNGEEFENITVSVVGWTWSAGGGGIKAEANAVETDIIKLLSQVA